jgi:hypothetical protein
MFGACLISRHRRPAAGAYWDVFAAHGGTSMEPTSCPSWTGLMPARVAVQNLGASSR